MTKPVRKTNAVTLVELLVCCAIIVVIAGLSMIGLGHSKRRASSIVAVSALRQASAALLIYQVDSDGLPDTQRKLEGGWLGPAGLWKHGAPTFKDPSFQQIRKSLVELPGYAINGCIGNNPVTHVGDTVLIATVGEFAEINGDGSQSELNVLDLMAIDEVQYGELGKKEALALGRDLVVLQEFGSRRHLGRGVYAFCDGRVAVLAPGRFVHPENAYLCSAEANVRLTRPLPGLGFMPVRPD